jgi:hypothetical protein
MDDWLRTARDALANVANVSPDGLDLDEDDESTLLELARLAAHDSGARTNAPLLCYLVGLARRNASLDELAQAVRGGRLPS